MASETFTADHRKRIIKAQKQLEPMASRLHAELERFKKNAASDAKEHGKKAAKTSNEHDKDIDELQYLAKRVKDGNDDDYKEYIDLAIKQMERRKNIAFGRELCGRLLRG